MFSSSFRLNPTVISAAVFFMALGGLCQRPLAAEVRQIIHGSQQPWEYEFLVDAAAEIQPALKYRLLPQQIDLRPGNAAVSYYRALRLYGEHTEQERKELETCQSYGLMIRPASTGTDGRRVELFDRERAEAVITVFEDVIEELRTAIRCKSCDWGIGFNEMTEFQLVNLRIGEFNDARKLARLIQLKARLKIATHHYEQAFPWIQMAFQLGRDIAQCPTVITGLIGTAISVEAQVLLMELIAEPGSPNLYWSLVTAPCPMVDIRPGLENELSWVFKIPLIREAEHSHSAAEWHRLALEAQRLLEWLRSNYDPNTTHPDQKLVSDQFDQWIEREYSRVKLELVQFQLPAERVSNTSAIQAIALHEALLARMKHDELLKIAYLPYHKAVPFFPSQRSPKPARLSDLKETIPLFESLYPAVELAMSANVRLHSRMVRLQVIEALRMYAADNAGKLPATLSEIQRVPIPQDPVTGEAIQYSLDGETAVIEFASPNSIRSLGEITRVTLRKPQ